MKWMGVFLAVMIMNGVWSISAQEKQNKDTVSIVPSGGLHMKVAESVREMVGHYLGIKNALADDNTKDAARGGKKLVDAMERLDKTLLTTRQMKIYVGVEIDIKEDAEHIGENAGNIGHQREHFSSLSKEVYDLVKAFGSGQRLYEDYCPMYDDGKGAVWLSESSEIKNPYFGREMLSCGSVKEEIK